MRQYLNMSFPLSSTNCSNSFLFISSLSNHFYPQALKVLPLYFYIVIYSGNRFKQVIKKLRSSNLPGVLIYSKLVLRFLFYEKVVKWCTFYIDQLKISYSTTLSSADNTAAPYTASSYLPCSSLSLIPAAHPLYTVSQRTPPHRH